MIHGHGDDLYRYGKKIEYNFSSNIPTQIENSKLYNHLILKMPTICSYPEPDSETLVKLIAADSHISPEQICITAGATEAIYLIAQAFAKSTSQIFEPTFSEYSDACRINNHRVIQTVLKEERGFSHCGGIDISEEANLVWLCNPNNPTGQTIDSSLIEESVRKRPNTTFIIDQSYRDFSQKNIWREQISTKQANVITINSLTKRYAIPGLRIGYAVSTPETINKIRSIMMPWSVNGLAIEAGIFLYSNRGGNLDISAITENLFSAQLQLREELSTMRNITTFKTDTHFFLCRLEKGSAKELKESLVKDFGILIRDASNFHGLDFRYFRIASQTPKANNELIKAIGWLSRLY